MPALKQEDPPRESASPRAVLTEGALSNSVLATTAALAAAAAVAAVLTAGAGEGAIRYGPVFLALGALVACLPMNRWLVGAAVLVGGWLVAVLAVRYVPHVYNPGPPVGQAIGMAAFVGTPYRGAQVGAVISVAVPVALALLVVWRPVSRHLGALPGLSRLAASPSPVAEERPRGRATVMWIGAAVIAFTIVPDLRSTFSHAGDPVAYIWDQSNVITWQLFVQMGLVPMKDFFYPYGFQWLFLHVASGPAIEWLAQSALIAVAASSLWRLSKGRTWRVLGCLLVLVLIGHWSPDGYRYTSGLLVAITYAALGPGRQSRLGLQHAALFAACLVAALYGPDALAMGLVGAVLVLLGEIVGGRITGSPRRIAAAVALDAVPVLAAIGLMLLVWLAIGSSAGNFRFLRDLTAISSADALDQRAYGPTGLMVLYPAMYSVWAAAPALLAAAGVLWSRIGPRDSSVGAILLAASGVSLVLVLKHFVRLVNDEVLIAPLLALAWSVILAWRRDSIVRTAACGAALASLLTMLEETGSLSIGHYVSTAVASPVHAVRSISVAFDPAARRRANAAELDPKRFAGWPDLDIAYQYLQAVHTAPLPSFAIVGDSQLTYPLLHQRPPYQVELYDSSPIAEQHAMVRDLERRRPAYVIFRGNYETDFVPQDVRDPLLYSWMINNYVPVRRFPGGAVLRRRAPGQPLPEGFWRTQIGGSEDLGDIPSYSMATGSPPCTLGPGCVPYALIQGHTTGSGGGIGLVVSGNGQAFGVTLRTRAGVADYPVRLDRLWFWPFVGPRPALRSLTPGVSVRLAGLRSGDNLY